MVVIFKGKDLWTEDDDQCTNCVNLRKCPLADTLKQGVVVMTAESLGVKDCGLYEGREPASLKLVQ